MMGGIFMRYEVFAHRRERMNARNFINETLLPWLEREITDEAKGNKQYLAGFEDAMKGMARFIESQRDEWDVGEKS
jgi:hypothetical protein